MSGPCANLKYGVHPGRSEVREEVPGFSISVMQPTFYAEDVPLHTHEAASLIFVIDGTYLTSADGPKKIDSQKMLIFNPAGTTHRDTFVVPRGRFMAVSMCRGMNGADMDFSTTASSFVDGEAVDAAERLMRLVTVAQDRDRSGMEDLCWELISVAGGSRSVRSKAETKSPAWLHKAHELLNDRATADLSISAIAVELGIHPVYLARTFRRHFHCSPAEYRMRCRLQRG